MAEAFYTPDAVPTILTKSVDALKESQALTPTHHHTPHGRTTALFMLAFYISTSTYKYFSWYFCTSD